MDHSVLQDQLISILLLQKVFQPRTDAVHKSLVFKEKLWPQFFLAKIQLTEELLPEIIYAAVYTYVLYKLWFLWKNWKDWMDMWINRIFGHREWEVLKLFITLAPGVQFITSTRRCHIAYSQWHYLKTFFHHKLFKEMAMLIRSPFCGNSWKTRLLQANQKRLSNSNKLELMFKNGWHFWD